MQSMTSVYTDLLNTISLLVMDPHSFIFIFEVGRGGCVRMYNEQYNPQMRFYSLYTTGNISTASCPAHL